MSGIEVSDLVKQWGKIRAVDGVSFGATEGTLTVLLGPSGCGKSTILRMIAGLEATSAGQIRIAGQDVTHLDAAKRGVSMVFQSYALFPHLSVKENILFGLKVRRVPADEREQRLEKAAHMVGLQALLDRKPANLSGGQRQRVALARTIVANQPVCLMDEPLSNLDAKLRAEMRDEIHGLQRRLGLTMIYVTHDQTEAMSMADQVVLLNGGHIEQIDTPANLYDRPKTVFAAQFLGMPPMNVLPIDALASLADVRKGGADGRSGWFLGVRPENLHFADSGLPVEVAAIDYMGAETVFRLRHEDNVIMARIGGRATTAIGSREFVTWDDKDVHLFDDAGIRQDRPEAASPNLG